MNFNKFCFILFITSSSILSAQTEKEDFKTLSQYPADRIKVDEFGNRYVYDAAQKAKIYEINGETVVVLDELILTSKPDFNNQLDRNYYLLLNKKLNRVYPLFLNRHLME